jgi:hypothetical protein
MTRRKSVRIKAGDIFDIPTPDGRKGYGQVILSKTLQYIVVFEELYATPPDINELLKSEIFLVGWTSDALFFHGRWKVIANRAPISERVPFPWYKVNVCGERCIHDFNGEGHRPATDEDWELLEFKSSRSPIGYQKALLAHHGLGGWESDYDELKAAHVWRRVRHVEDQQRCS